MGFLADFISVNGHGSSENGDNASRHYISSKLSEPEVNSDNLLGYLKRNTQIGPPEQLKIVYTIDDYLRSYAKNGSIRTSSLVEFSSNDSGLLGDDTTKSEFYERNRKRFVQLAQTENIEYGYESASEIMIHEIAEKSPSEIGGLIQHIYLRECSNQKVIVCILKAVSSLSYSSIYPYAQLMAIAALANSSAIVQEAGIRAFENWEHLEGIEPLRNAKTGWPWLETYRLETISYLESFK